ncbi:MAG: proline racemase family protein [Alphaproteobacteria bacterium]
MANLENIVIETTEMHSGGEPVRIVTSGYPPVEGDTILAKRRYARERLDHLRRFLLFEPRGHAGMYGVIPVEPDLDDADLAVLFMHNEGYSTMCGHAVIALARWAVHTGRVERRGAETRVNIQCPCGLVRARATGSEDEAGAVYFQSVPAFAFALDRAIEVPGHGEISVDIGYGGAFYALAPASAFGLDLRQAPVRDLVDAADAVSRAVTAQVPLAHPDDADLAFLYGTILTDGADAHGETATANVCVFAKRQVDRSPTGGGVTARIAIMRARGQIRMGQTRRFESITGSVFSGRAVAESRLGEFDAVTVEVGGRAHFTGGARFTVEPDDMLAGGFLLR